MAQNYKSDQQVEEIELLRSSFRKVSIWVATSEIFQVSAEQEVNFIKNIYSGLEQQNSRDGTLPCM